MNRYTHLAMGCAVWLLGTFCLVDAGGSVGAQAVDYQRDVQPILAERCMHCHGAGCRDATGRIATGCARVGAARRRFGQSRDCAGQAGGERVDPARDLRGRGRSHAAGRGEQTAECGAGRDLEAVDQRGCELRGALGLRAARSRSTLPPPGPTHPVDAFVVARLQSLQLQPAPRGVRTSFAADCTWISIGLPPSPQELDAFEKQGLEATIESLLQSERFGEKWARHWLDAARYSDTNGYEKDMPREQWAWRDWVIHALNRDMPYDQFLIEQVAGDLLPNATQEQIVATGFLAQQHAQRRRRDHSRNSFACSRCSIAWIAWAKRCSA